MHFSSVVTVALLAIQTAALPRRYFENPLFSALFSFPDQRNIHAPPSFLQRPLADTVTSAVSPSRPQELSLSTLPQLQSEPPVPPTPQSLSHGQDHSTNNYLHPTPLATAQPYPLSEEPNYGRVCNLGNRVDPRQEDAAELAYAACQGGMVRRLTRFKPEGAGGDREEGADEVLECVACEVGSWNAVRGEINR